MIENLGNCPFFQSALVSILTILSVSRTFIYLLLQIRVCLCPSSLAQRDRQEQCPRSPHRSSLWWKQGRCTHTACPTQDPGNCLLVNSQRTCSWPTRELLTAPILQNSQFQTGQTLDSNFRYITVKRPNHPRRWQTLGSRTNTLWN